jgi:hypothetical protein
MSDQTRDYWRFDLEWFHVTADGVRQFHATPVVCDSLGEAESRRLRTLNLSWAGREAVEPSVGLIRQLREGRLVRIYDQAEPLVASGRFKELRGMLRSIGEKVA